MRAKHRLGIVLAVVALTPTFVVAMPNSAVALGATSWGGPSPATATSDEPVAARAARPEIRDVGEEAGLDSEIFSFGAHPRDFDDDTWPDLLLLHHSGPAQVLHNDEGSGFSLVAELVDTLHEKKDRHDCAWADVDHDGNDDIYCTKGAHKGTAEKWNELWIQDPPGVFTDRAAEFGVEDRWGRGRLAAFLDINHDAYPDLFVGNEYPRHDGRWSPNRTFVNVGGTHFEQVHMGITRELGAECVQVVDVNADGRDDLLLCGKRTLYLFVRKGDRYIQRAPQLGVQTDRASWAWIARLDANGSRDLVVVRNHSVQIQRRRLDGTFGSPQSWHLQAGEALAVGDVDGVRGADVLVVEGCVDGVNIGDSLLLNRGAGDGWDRQRLFRPVAGCGDVAATLDFDRDGMDDFVVMNGRPRQTGKGPDQLLTAGDWSAP